MWQIVWFIDMDNMGGGGGGAGLDFARLSTKKSCTLLIGSATARYAPSKSMSGSAAAANALWPGMTAVFHAYHILLGLECVDICHRHMLRL